MSGARFITLDPRAEAELQGLLTSSARETRLASARLWGDLVAFRLATKRQLARFLVEPDLYALRAPALPGREVVFFFTAIAAVLPELVLVQVSEVIGPAQFHAATTNARARL